MKQSLKKLLSILLAVVMTLSLGSIAFALDEGAIDDYTDIAMNGGGGTGGTYYSKDVFDNTIGTDYTDETFTTYKETTAIEGAFPDEYPPELFRKRTDEEVQKLIDAIIPVLTFEEKCQLISASSNDDPDSRNGVGYVDGVPRLGIPETRMNDGPAGINSLAPKGYEATNPPNQLLSSMTWDPDLEYQYGETLGAEHISNGIGWQLGTQLDIARSPFFARIKDTFGEDHYLAARMGVAEVSGLQGNGGMSMSKHIGAYSTDGDTRLWLEVDEQTLHTAYLYPFEVVAKEAQLASIMGTYNRLNGFYTSSNLYLQIGVLRNMWNWKGAMVPDWGADKESFSMLTGSTLLQGNAESIGKNIRSAVYQGLMDMEDVDFFVSTVLYAYGVSGFLELVQIDPNTGLAMEEPGRTAPIEFQTTYAADRLDGLYEESNDVALKMAEEGIVLAKNENNTLPLKAEDYTGDKSVALIGYGAVSPITGTGGERADGVGQYMSSPYESIQKVVGEEANVEAFVTGDKHGSEIPAEVVFQTADGSATGWVDEDGTIYNTPCLRPEVRGNIVNGETGKAIEPMDSKTLTGYFQAAETGTYKFCVQYTNGSQATFTVEGAEAKRSDSGGGYDYQTVDGSSYTTYSVNMVAGQRYKITVTAKNNFNFRVTSLNVNYMVPNNTAKDYEAAKQAAANHDTVIMFTRTGATGHGPVFVTDYDISLDEKEQVKEISDIAKENGNKFVLVTYSRSAFTFEGNWLDNTDALLLAFYPGQAGSTAIANILTGVVNPSGKLTLTMPKAATDTLLTFGIEDITRSWYNPTDLLVERAGLMAKPNADGTKLENQEEYTAKYTEGLSFGYRWYDETGIEPQYSFGHGLSYTTFEYSDYKVEPSQDGTSVDVTVTVKNTGDVTGSEIVQVYVGAPQNVPEHVQTVNKQLAAFQRINDLAPGESRTVTMTVEQRMLSYWDSELDLIEREDGTKDKWVLGDGERTIYVGSSFDNLTYEEMVEIGKVEPSIEAPEAAEIGEEFELKVTLDNKYTALKLVNETGRAVSMTGLNVTYGETAATWNISTKVGTIGKRSFTVLAKKTGGGYEDIGLKFDIEITESASGPANVRVLSASFGSSTVAKNTKVNLTAKTTSNASKIQILSENDRALGKTLTKKTVSGSSIEWVYETSIGTAGARQFTVAAAGDNGVYNYDYVRVATIVVK